MAAVYCSLKSTNPYFTSRPNKLFAFVVVAAIVEPHCLQLLTANII